MQALTALIFNSGTGSRMGEWTSNRPKCLLLLPNGETILARQLRILAACGITEAVITTGAYTSDIAQEAKKVQGIHVVMVENPDYAQTNYIDSMARAQRYLHGDLLILHGDLVFDSSLVQRMLARRGQSICIIHPTEPLPLKDFKGRVRNQQLKEVSVKIFDADCYALQPMYLLTEAVAACWCNAVANMVADGIRNVYAEVALNPLLETLPIKAISYEGCFVREIDTPEDYFAVGFSITQYDAGNFTSLAALSQLFQQYHAHKPFAVIGRHLQADVVKPMYCYRDYRENPDVESIQRATDSFYAYGGDLLVAIGGGSVIDTAKGIQAALPRRVPLIAIPTTAGSGSEATPFAVVYRDGVKTSLDDQKLLPDAVILEPKLLYSLNKLQRMIPLLDATCHGIESLLSIHATPLSCRHAEMALRLIATHWYAYATGDRKVYGWMLIAAHEAGKAIAITRTSAGHAMCYGLTVRFGIRHGQAAAVCLLQILAALRSGTLSPPHSLTLSMEAIQQLHDLLSELYGHCQFPDDQRFTTVHAQELAQAVNQQRLQNSAIPLPRATLLHAYEGVIQKLSGTNDAV